jgi:hypothetical protein
MIVLVEGAIRQHITHVAQNTRDGVFSGMNDLVEKLSGQKPMEMIDYIIKNKALFISLSRNWWWKSLSGNELKIE